MSLFKGISIDIPLMTVGLKIFLGTQYLKFNYKARERLEAMKERDIHTRKSKAPSGWRVYC